MMLLTTLSLIMTIIILRFFHKDGSPAPPQRLLTVIASVECLCPTTRVTAIHLFKKTTPTTLSRSVNKMISCDCDEKNRSDTSKEKPNKETEEISKDKKTWKYVARVLDRLFLFIFMLVFLLATSVSLLLSSMSDNLKGPIADNGGYVCPTWKSIS